jgi:tungstate transport system substrate-binding protein
VTRKGFTLAALLALLAAAPAAAQPRVAIGGEPAAAALVAALAPAVAQATGKGLTVTAAGDAQAGAAVRACRADLAILPSPELMAGFEAEGIVRPARPLMTTSALVVGPARDRANARSAPNAAGALRSIAQARAPFVSWPGGAAHRIEMSLWNRARVDYRLGRDDWWHQAADAAALGEALREGAYAVLTRAEWLALGGETLAAPVQERDPALAIAFRAAPLDAYRCLRSDQAGAQAALDWLTGPFGRDAIAAWAVGGAAPFAPAAP